jgi:hypothetical protein
MTKDDLELTKVVAMANKHQAAMATMPERERMDYVRKVVDEADLVWGVWQDGADPAMDVIKGKHALADVLASGQSRQMRIDAIPCINYEQMVAARWMLGDGREQ